MTEERPYTVRTLILANFRDAAAAVVAQRHKPAGAMELANAMKRLELADKVLEDELNRFSERGFDLVGTIEHDAPDGEKDLVMTVVLRKRPARHDSK